MCPKRQASHNNYSSFGQNQTKHKIKKVKLRQILGGCSIDLPGDDCHPLATRACAGHRDCELLRCGSPGRAEADGSIGLKAGLANSSGSDHNEYKIVKGGLQISL